MKPPLDRLERVEAWGMASASLAYVYRPTTEEGIIEAFESALRMGKTVALMGGGNSYGDAFQNAENVVVDLSRMKRIISWDPVSGEIECEPGVTIRDLWRYTIEDGWWPPVVSGTSFVTLGGAVAANFHGKNNWHAGPIGEHLASIDVLLTSGKKTTLLPESDEFKATVGGFGLLGAIVSIKLRMRRIYSGSLNVEAISVANWDEAFHAFEQRIDEADYMVGWIDAFASGGKAGRGLIHVANYPNDGADPHPEETLKVRAQELPDTVLGWISRSRLNRLMKPFVNNVGMRLINWAKYRGGKREHGHKVSQPIVAFNFLLDSAPNWKWCYKPGGLIQYQPFIPSDRARVAFEKIIELSQDRGLVPYLAVMKRHRPDSFLLSHAVDGYSLALDYRVTQKNRERVWSLARALDEIVLENGGKFYFAKDSTLTRGMPSLFLGEDAIAKFQELKRRFDPENLLQSELSKRVFGPWELRPSVAEAVEPEAEHA
jgi:FAD/FMN-containing dehydrogenase